MTGEPAFSSASIEIPPSEAAAGATKVVFTATHGPVTVEVPPGTADGAVLWVETPGGTVAVTIRVPSAFTPPPPFPVPDPPAADPTAVLPSSPAAPAADPTAVLPTAPPPSSAPPSSGPPSSAPPASGPPASGPPSSVPPASGPPAWGPPPVSGAPASDFPAPGAHPVPGGYPPGAFPPPAAGYPPGITPAAGYPQSPDGSTPGGYPPGSFPGGAYPPGAGQPGAYPPGSYPPGSYPPGAGQPGAYPPGAEQPGAYPPGAYPAGAYPPGAFQPGGYPPGQGPAFAGPPAAPPTRRRNQLIAGGLVGVLLVGLGCCGVVRLFSGGDDDTPQAKKRNGIVATTPTTAGPVTPEQYAQVLAASDTAIKAPFARLNTGDNAAFARAAPTAANAIRAEAGKLRSTKPPSGAESVHFRLTQGLENLGDMVEETAGTKQECPAASPYAAVLQSGWADGLREDAKKLVAADPAYRFGSFLPAEPKQQNRRLKTGTFVKRSSTGGLGHLKIKNGASDTLISLVPNKGKKPKPVFTVYVRKGGTYTAKGIRDGTYRIYTASGQDWNAGKKGFTRNCHFSKFDDTFKFTTTSFSSSIWTITLTPMIGGNASTSDVDPNAFPN
ncbi:hypothetical protein [Pseudosporangium ferrugineum]|uniref:Uncharacterized protein n=1 Tax=Pseudosporangium ferrugineum TaxID=439699 RepID=A0A2T0S2I0_9ACTN|nr:hypothetical protein [Pseudosporangium ferrugineum]PRY27636.1 hypothetical protein CLV70_110223 [Pseudosporangium ferrugineum]